jgi:molecular chaperone GrpE
VTNEPHAEAPPADDADETVGSASSEPAGSVPDATEVIEAEVVDEVDEGVTVDLDVEPVEVSAEIVEDDSNSDLDAMRTGLDELTRDLQRVTAEYANYRKRVDRDRALAAEQATGQVLASLLPVLDDLDRARNHGDLVGPFASVADQLSAALGKYGLTAFGDVGDPFDPTVHEAVAHTSSPDVTETACIEIMRRGYLLGERLLRPALVAVADPE